MLSHETLRGYVLEELLAARLRNSGFDLLVDPSQDPTALEMASNGLRIRGRGALHQVDVLGQLRIRIPFMYRLRLFVEAKYRSAPTGLGDVRNALGVLNDVNEHYSWQHASLVPRYSRFHYKYALFSATGFTKDAQRYAITQQISLVDLSDRPYGWILDAADRIAAALLSLALELGLDSFPVGQAREALRRALRTWPQSESLDEDSFAAAEKRARSTTENQPLNPLPPDRLARIAAEAADVDGDLLLGFMHHPYLVVMQPDDGEGAQDLLRAAGRDPLTAELSFGGRTPAEGQWVLSTSDRHATFRLALPPEFEDEVLGAEPKSDGSFDAADRLITIPFADETAELHFRPLAETEVSVVSEPSDRAQRAEQNYARAARLAPGLTYRRTDEVASTGLWTAAAVRELLHRLRQEGWPHADIIEFAVENGGYIERADLYRIADYPETRMLRGFTRPTHRITLDLMSEGLLDEGASWPIYTQYAAGVVASHFTVPGDIVDILTR